MDTPDPLFYSYYASCVRTIAKDQTYSDISVLKKIVGAEIYTLIQKDASICSKLLNYGYKDAEECFKSNSYEEQAVNSLKIVKLPADLQLKLTEQIIRYLVGPEPVLQESRLIGVGNVFSADLKSDSDLAHFLVTNLSSLKNENGENLTLIEYYAELAILLRLGPVVKH